MFWAGLLTTAICAVLGFALMLAAGSSNRYPRAYDWAIYGCMAGVVIGVLLIILGAVR